METKKIILTGLGGQGILLAGKLIANAAFLSGFYSSFLPVYGPEVHNGKVKAEIIISEEEIYNPFIDKADYLVIFHKFRLKDSLQLVDNNSVIICKDFLSENSEVKTYNLITDKISENFGESKVENVITIGALMKFFPEIKDKSIGEALKKLLSDKPYSVASANFKAYKQGKELIQI